MNLLLIGYCHLADGFLYASNSLNKRNYNIFFFPFWNYKLDNKEDLEIINDFKSIIENNNIKICLWWNNSIGYEIFIKMYNKNLINILYNWDPFLYDYEKYNCIFWKSIIDRKKKIYPNMDIILTCFEKEINFFKNLEIDYASPGFDKLISFYKFQKEYECDISIVCTNFYENINEFPLGSTNISRSEIVDKLYEYRDEFKFKIYGPENFKNKYPDCYVDFINYNNCNLVFSNSKINLSIHPLVNELNEENTEFEYFSERLPQILGCKGLLATNSNLNKYLVKEEDYIFIDENTDIINLFRKILNNNKEYDKIRKNGYNKSIDYYQWDKWGEIIDNKIINLKNCKCAD